MPVPMPWINYHCIDSEGIILGHWERVQQLNNPCLLINQTKFTQRLENPIICSNELLTKYNKQDTDKQLVSLSSLRYSAEIAHSSRYWPDRNKVHKSQSYQTKCNGFLIYRYTVIFDSHEDVVWLRRTGNFESYLAYIKFHSDEILLTYKSTHKGR